MNINLNKATLISDIQSGLVVFLVALPLCLGIALASGAPLFAGIISGIVGGIVIGLLSNSQLSVSGPAAGLTAIVLSAITSLGSYETFLLAVILAGAIQLILSVAKAGTISNYIPSNVIEGMLAAIGIIIILKQLPHAIGYDIDNEGDFFFIEKSGSNTFSTIFNAINYSHPGAIIITTVSLLIMIAFTKVEFLKKIKAIPGALIAVIIGITINEVFKLTGSTLAISQDHLVKLPTPRNFNEFVAQFSFPEISGINNPSVWIIALTLAIVASIETLLCIEAADKMDPLKRHTNTNRELFAQGIGNIISGLIGGLPITSVIVRTSANANAGVKTKASTIIHGILLLIAVLTIPFILNKIPLACLAAILLITGYKLAGPSVFKLMYKGGKYQFTPFIVTVIAVVFTDLLKGVAIGFIISVFYLLRANLKLAYFFKKEDYHEGQIIKIKLAQEVSFLNKAAIKQTLHHLPVDSKVVIDASDTFYIDYDVLKIIRDFIGTTADEKKISITLTGFKSEYKLKNALSHVISK